MTGRLRVLLVEDSETDAKLIGRELSRQHPGVEVVRAEDGPSMRAALGAADWDVVLCDWTLPTFSGPAALALVAEVRPELPLIVVSGTIGEDVAVAAMRQGAADYLLKDRLSRLGLAIDRAVEAARARAATRAVERALHLSEQRFRAMVDHGWDAILLLDREGKVRYCAETTTRLLGYPAEELVGQSPVRFVHPDDVERVGRAIGECAARPGTIEVTGRVRHQSGAYLLLEGQLTNLLDHPAVSAIVVNYRDVTERNRTTDELARSEARFRAYMANTPMVASLKDASGRFVFVNAAWRHWYGGDREVIGRTLHELWPAPIAEQMAAQDREVRETGASHDSQMELAGADGTPTIWQVFRFPVRDVAGETLVGRLALDVTERVRGQAAQERLRHAVAAGNVGLWEWDIATNVVYYSPEWKRQIGHEDHEIGSSLDEWSSRVHPDDLDQTTRAVLAHLAAESPAYAVEFRLRHKDGSYRNILAQASAVRGEDGRPRRLLGTHVDITARVQLQAQLLHAQKLDSIGQLAGGIAHDFNNLITVINTTAELASADLRPDDPLRADLLEIEQAGRRAAALTRQLLTFSRKQLVSPTIVQVAPLVADLQRMLARLIGEHIALVVAAQGTGTIRVDAGQLEQVIVNLAVNARDAMPDGGTLRIETCDVELDLALCAGHPGAHPGPHVRLTVSDTGTGMDEQTRSRLFEPFFTTKAVGRGTGLGLATAYGIVAQCGGTIAVRTAIGHGTTFEIHLPRVEAIPTARPSRELMIAAGARASRETIVVVEDEPAIRRMCARILESAGYRVQVAANAGEALLLFERSAEPMRLLISDVVMPGISGRQLADRLRPLHPGLAVLFTSGYTEDEIVRLGVLDDPRTFLAKPYSSTELTGKVRAILDAT